MIEINTKGYCGLAINEKEIGDWAENHRFEITESDFWFFHRIVCHINESRYHEIPRFMTYSVEKNEYGHNWQYIDWGHLTFFDILSRLGPTKQYFDGVLRIIRDKVYVFWPEHVGYGDIEYHIDTMSIEEWNDLLVIR